MDYDALPVDSIGFEMTFYFGISVVMAAAFINRFNGRLFRIGGMLADKKWVTVTEEKAVVRLASFLKFFAYFFIVSPFVVLYLWGGAVVEAKKKVSGGSVLAGIEIMFVGTALITAIYGILNIRWSKYRFTRTTGIVFIISVIFFGAYQLCGIFLDTIVSFYGVSAIFLSTNAILVVFVAFINSGDDGISIRDVISERFKDDPAQKEEHREDDFEEEIIKELEDPNYFPNQQDIYQFFTIHKVKTGSMASAYEGGFQKLFQKYTQRQKFTFSLVLYIISVGVLVAYSYIIKYTTDYNVLGFMIMVAILSTDTIIFFYFHAKVARSPMELSLLILTVRICLFGLGGDYWFYGYCLLYLIIGASLSWNISEKRFPLVEPIARMAPRRVTTMFIKRQYADLTKTPEFILGFSTLICAILVIVLAFANIKGVPLPHLYIKTVSFSFWIIGLICILLIVIFYCVITLYRIFERRKRNIYDRNVYYLFIKVIDTYWGYILVTYGAILIGAFVGWGVTEEVLFVILGAFGPLILIVLLHVYAFYALNDYNVLMDVELYNRQVTKKNELKLRIKEKVIKYKQEMGNTFNNSNTFQGLLSQTVNLKPSDSPVNKSQFIQKKLVEPPRVRLLDNEINRESKLDNSDLEFNLDQNKAASIIDISKIEEAEVDDNNTNKNGQGMPQTMTINIPQSGEVNLKLEKTMDEWRSQYGVISALFKGKLTSNDYHIILGYALSVILIALMGLTISINYQSSYGVTYSIAFYFYLFTLSPLTKYLINHMLPSIIQIVTIIFAFALLYAWGIAYFFIAYSGYFGHDSNGTVFIFIYLVIMPLTVTFGTAFYKWHDNKWKLEKLVLGGLILSGLYLAALIAILYASISWQSGLALSLFLGILAYMIAMIVKYVRNDYFFTRSWQITNYVVSGLASIAAFIVSLAVKNFDVFAGFSISFGCVMFILTIYVILAFIRDIKKIDIEPVFYSPWIFPVYKYSSKINDIKKHGRSAAIALVILFSTLVWSVLCSIWITPAYIGVSISCLIEVVIVIFYLYISGLSSRQLKHTYKYCSDDIIKKAWLEAKEAFVVSRNAVNMKQFISHHELTQRRSKIYQHLRSLKSNSVKSDDDMSWNVKNIDAQSVYQVERFLFKVDQARYNQYMEELQLIVSFQLFIVVMAIAEVTIEKQLLFKFIKDKNAQLIAAGIHLKIVNRGDSSLKYVNVMMQISRLSPEKQTLLNNMRDEFESEQRRIEAELKQKELIEEEAARKRKKEMIKREKERLEKLKTQELNDDSNLSIDVMVDSLKKYEKIMKEFKETGKKFEDKQFLPNDASLGEVVRPRCGGWQRATEDMVIYVDGVDPLDVTQGALGDCYFLSAMSVLGETYVKKCIITKDTDPKCGAYCIRFYHGDQELYIIVDDYFPKFANGEWAMVKSSNPKELWPMIIEKAYAKMNGSYSFIEAGKVQYALADLTGGAPEQITLATVKSHDTIWEKLKLFKQSQYLMGAGSPESSRAGVLEINEDGIVQGHAYAILEVEEV